MTIAITGATGQLGRLVLQSLACRAPTAVVVALARSPERAADLGVAVRPFDYEQPATLRPALAGVETLLLISGNQMGRRVAQHRNVIAAAKQAGVGRVVYTSLLHADTSPLDIAPEHRTTEAELTASGVPYTILRHGWYTENYTATIQGALASGALLGSAGDGRISSAARADYAEADAVVLVGDGHEGETYELAGDEAWTLTDLAAEVSRQAGRMVPYHDLPPAEYAEVLLGAGLPEPLAHTIPSYDAATARGALFDDARQLSRLIGRPTTPLAAAVAKMLQGHAAAPAAGN